MSRRPVTATSVGRPAVGCARRGRSHHDWAKNHGRGRSHRPGNADRPGHDRVPSVRCGQPRVDRCHVRRSVATPFAHRRGDRQRGHGRERPVSRNPPGTVAGTPRPESYGELSSQPGGRANHGPSRTAWQARLRARRSREDSLQRFLVSGHAVAGGFLLRRGQGGAGLLGSGHGPGTRGAWHSRERGGAGHYHGRPVAGLLRDRSEIPSAGNCRHPLARVWYTRTVRDAFLFLASDESDYITGVSLLVDGGASLPRRD